jgi:hypothetical protein
VAESSCIHKQQSPAPGHLGSSRHCAAQSQPYWGVGGVRRTSVGSPMAKNDHHEPQIYQLRVALRGISPLIWRRLLVRSDSTIAELHQALQVAHRPCPCCRRPRTLKGYHPLRFRSAFGDLELRSPRWYECACEGRPAQATFSPLNKLLTTHTAPELEFLQAKWAAHVSFGAVADLLHDVLPIDSARQ